MTQEPVNYPLVYRLSLLVCYGLGLNAKDHELDAEVFNSTHWALVYRYAAAHGLAAVAWDGLSRMVQEGRVDVPKELKLRWFGHTMMAERRYGAQKAALQSLAEALEGTSMRVVVMKGAAVAESYPVPKHRECGDVDVLPLGGSAEQLRDLLIELGAKVGVDSPKHIEMEFRGVTFEVHREFVSTMLLKPYRHLNATLLSLASKGRPLFGSEKLVCPPAEFDALFLTAHAANHFKSEGIMWRHVVDAWLATDAVLPSEKALQRYGLARFAWAVYDVGVWFFSSDSQSASMLSADARLLMEDIGGLMDNRPTEGGLFQRKWQRFWSRRKVCRLAGEPFYKIFWRSVWAHLRQPAAIGRGVG